MALDTDLSLRNKMIYSVFVRNYSSEGTLKAVEKDLSRIRSLGTDIIWLMPIQPSGMDHRKGTVGSPYAIQDYRRVDPALGTMDDFISLCNAIHVRGMKVILDVVYHHTSPDSVLAKTHPEWFCHKADGSFGNRIGDWWDVVDLDFSDHALWDELIDTLKMWAQYVDGFRCDVAPLVPVAFWKEARAEVKKVRPDCIWLAESSELKFVQYCRYMGIGSASDSEMYEAFDICYDYDAHPFFDGYLNGKNSLESYIDILNLQECIYPENYVKLRYVENHDRERAAALIHNTSALINWTAFACFQKGTTLIYNGEEYGITHKPSLFDPDPIDWNHGTYDLTSLIASMHAIHADPFFSDTCCHVTALDSHVLQTVHTGCLRGSVNDDRKCAGIFNVSKQAKAVHTDLPDGTYTDLFSHRSVSIENGTMELDENPVIFWLN